jgi:hypothetical protein
MRLFLSAATALVLAACTAVAIKSRAPKPPMNASITYLHLLRHTPFFTELETEQLRWVIAHSKEWEVQPGTVLLSDALATERAGYWILLDGGWTLDYRGNAYSSGHGDSSKWIEARQLRGPFQLSVNTRSYVMHIALADMQEMLARGFKFERHLEQDTVRSEREGEQVLQNLRCGREPKGGNGIHLLIPEVPLRKN